MKWQKPTTVEWVTFATVIPAMAALLNVVMFGDRFMTNADIWIYSYPFILLMGVAGWLSYVFIMHRLRKRYPSISDTGKRLTLLAASHVLVIGLSYAVIFVLYHFTHHLNFHFDAQRFRFSLSTGLAISLIAATSWEASYTLKQYKLALTEKEKLEQLTLQHEFDALKSQVNPHFLFNCFNTLSSLISEDVDRAEVFLDEMSKVYRYLLKNNEDGTSTLEKEIEFIRSYSGLLQTRHGEAVQIHIETDRKYSRYILPSLSLQLLIENAVKHNVLSKNKPLVIDIFTTAGNKLVVSNNLQVRQKKAPSNRIGLDNIKSKYDLLNQKGFQVLENTKTFSVVLPLIWNPVKEEAAESVAI